MDTGFPTSPDHPHKTPPPPPRARTLRDVSRDFRVGETRKDTKGEEALEKAEAHILLPALTIQNA